MLKDRYLYHVQVQISVFENDHAEFPLDERVDNLYIEHDENLLVSKLTAIKKQLNKYDPVEILFYSDKHSIQTTEIMHDGQLFVSLNDIIGLTRELIHRATFDNKKEVISVSAYEICLSDRILNNKHPTQCIIELFNSKPDIRYRSINSITPTHYNLLWEDDMFKQFMKAGAP